MELKKINWKARKANMHLRRKKDVEIIKEGGYIMCDVSCSCVLTK